MSKIYFPILKAKIGEFGAISALSSDIKSKMTPILEIPPIGIKVLKDKTRRRKTQDEHFKGFTSRLSRAWVEEFYLDSHFVSDANLINDKNLLLEIYNELFALGSKVIPVVNLYQHEMNYIDTISDIIKTNQLNLCIRLNANDVNTNLKESIDVLLDKSNLQVNKVDFILDYKYVLNSQESIITSSAIQIFKLVPYLEDWRKVIFSCTSFPMDLREAQRNTIMVVARTELAIWQNILSANDVIRKPLFSDYGISNPDITDFDPLKMQMSANIRYTGENVWHLVKGQSLKTKASSEQNVNLCQKIIKQDFFYGGNYSWGDEYIFKCANREVSPGNPTTWRKVGTNHHLTLTANQISNLF